MVQNNAYILQKNAKNINNPNSTARVKVATQTYAAQPIAV
jgi:hypothetical protein